ncbi:hypothetical protein [Amycolatopsis sp. FDAARGOS 1241]|uniref:hypothetical protein n=1 Tax=Amycolatopsis sp. FDAARGOS 1241 TaxID=2778070 RepID=UPI00194F8182|nr:hypothetical protein [Amycolatopsis sp. FDAARGOS 1241]QRP43226.1 hypothetical protein I6J71_27835 [Amycolatopsis sp. FDAARGOS 1241]
MTTKTTTPAPTPTEPAGALTPSLDLIPTFYVTRRGLKLPTWPHRRHPRSR